MTMFVLGMLCGGIAIGAVANRRPQWFALVVSAANAVDDAANAAVKTGVSKL